MRDDGEILPPETAALIRAGLSPRERVEDVVALAVHISARRASLREEAPDVDDVLANWDTLGLEQRRDFLEEHVIRIIVQDDSVEVEV